MSDHFLCITARILFCPCFKVLIILIDVYWYFIFIFNSHFPSSKYFWTSFDYLTPGCLLEISYGNFLIGLFGFYFLFRFLLLSLKNYICILERNSFSDMQFKTIVSQYLASLLSLIECISELKFLILMKHNLYFFI